MNSRLTHLDLAKCFGIIFMVFCHGMVPYTADLFIHAFHMPLFFIVSGWCFSVKRHPKFGEFIKTRAKSLLVPYLFWSVVIFTGWQCFYALTNPAKTYSIGNFLIHTLYDTASYSPFCAVQWFLPCMFFTGILGWISLRITKEKIFPTVLVALAYGLLGWGCSFLPIRLPLALDVALAAACFFLAGWLLGKLPPKKLFHPLATLLYLVVGSGIAFYNGMVNMRIMTYQNPLLFYTAGILLTLGILGICHLLCRLAPMKGLLFIGKNTLPILMLNQVFWQIIKQLVSTENPWIYAAFTLGIMGCMIPCILFLHKFLPFSVGKKKPTKNLG